MRSQAHQNLVLRAAKLNENEFIAKRNGVFWIGNRGGQFLSRPKCPHCLSRFTYLVVVDVPLRRRIMDEWRCGIRECRRVFDVMPIDQRHTACTACHGRGVFPTGTCSFCSGRGWWRR